MPAEKSTVVGGNVIACAARPGRDDWDVSGIDHAADG
jgi:hypothetical protein